jgi:DNA-directed RNA polymerase omega subunit
MQQPQAQDIISLPIELNDRISDTKFRLVHISAQRVRQLSSGAPMLVSTRSIKDTTIALEESLIGKFTVVVGEEAKKAKEEFRKREERARMEEQLSAKEEEIRKELSAYLSESQNGEGADEASLADVGDEEADTEEATKSDESDEPGD